MCKDLPAFARCAMHSHSNFGDPWSRLPEPLQIGVIVLVTAAITVVLRRALHLHTDAAIALGLGTIGIVALVYANHQFRDARITILQLNALTGELRDTKSQLSTERLQEFPAFLSQIVTMLGKATTKVEIFCDYPAYGIWSNPDAYRRYADAIEATTANVRLVCLNEWRRTQLAQERLDREAFDVMRTDPRMRAFLADYQGRREASRPCPSPEAITREEFLHILEDSNKNALERQFVSGDKRQSWETDLFMPLFFWIVDDTEAVFALAPHTAPTQQDLGFRTRDELLIGALHGVLDGYIRVRSSTEKDDKNRIGLVGFAGGLREWRELVRCSSDCQGEAVRLRAEIEKWVTPTASGGDDLTPDGVPG